MADQGLLSLEKQWIVPATADGIRLDAFVRQCLPHLSRRVVKCAIDDGLFYVNGEPAKKGDRLKPGDALAFDGPEDCLSIRPLPGPQIEVPIVYEDSFLLAVDKPAGMDTHGFSGRERLALTNFLAARRPELAAIGKSPWEPGLVHRLDRETSGLILIAKSQQVYENLRKQFRERAVRKQYWALVWGEARRKGLITFPITHDSRNRGKMRAILDSSKPRRRQRIWNAATRFRRLAARHGLSFLEIDMETGVTHQIRLHLAAAGHPIIGDRLYGEGRCETFGLRRHFLHAFRIELRHPAAGGLLRIESALPEELKDVLRGLGISY